GPAALNDGNWRVAPDLRTGTLRADGVGRVERQAVGAEGLGAPGGRVRIAAAQVQRRPVAGAGRVDVGFGRLQGELRRLQRRVVADRGGDPLVNVAGHRQARLEDVPPAPGV